MYCYVQIVIRACIGIYNTLRYGAYNVFELCNMECSWLEASLHALAEQPADAHRADEVRHPVDIKGAAFETGMTVNYR